MQLRNVRLDEEAKDPAAQSVSATDMFTRHVMIATERFIAAIYIKSSHFAPFIGVLNLYGTLGKVPCCPFDFWSSSRKLVTNFPKV